MASKYSSLIGALAAVVVIIALFVLLIVFGKPASSDTRTTQEVAMSCTTDMATEFHIHPHIAILVDGVSQVIPAEIGITNGCMHPLHTHETDGVIHVESPVVRDFTLSDFFAVWGKTFDRDHILDFVADETHVVTMTVNGTPSQDFEHLVLKDKDQIVISYDAVKTE